MSIASGKCDTALTLGDLIDCGYTINLICGDCYYVARPALYVLEKVYGREHAILRDPVNLRCDLCGSRGVAVTLNEPAA